MIPFFVSVCGRVLPLALARFSWVASISVSSHRFAGIFISVDSSRRHPSSHRVFVLLRRPASTLFLRLLSCASSLWVAFVGGVVHSRSPVFKVTRDVTCFLGWSPCLIVPASACACGPRSDFVCAALPAATVGGSNPSKPWTNSRFLTDRTCLFLSCLLCIFPFENARLTQKKEHTL